MTTLLRLMLVAMIAAVVFYMISFAVRWSVFLGTPVNLTTKPIEFVLKPGSSAVDLANDLYRAGLIQKPRYFISLVRFNRGARRLQAGMYSIKPGAYPHQLLEQMMLGQVMMHALTIINGWDFSQVKNTLKDNPFLTHTLQNMENKALMQFVGSEEHSPEGLFFPDTYLFAGHVKDTVILKTAYQKMQTVLKGEWEKRRDNLWYDNAYQALIVASLVEKEASGAQERARVAGVILRRLKKNMLLQIDPTVIYALGKHYKGRLMRDDLKIDSPYNTYRYKGLPPTPIAMPSEESIHAALHPAKGHALYFVSKGDGTHIFTNNLAAHNKAVEKYIGTKKGSWRIIVVKPNHHPVPKGIDLHRICRKK